MRPHENIAMAVTFWFECGDRPYTLAVGNFDGQGVSFGPRQTNYGQGTLQPLLRKAITMAPAMVDSCFGDLAASLRKSIDPSTNGLDYAVTWMNDKNNRIRPEWAEAFARLGAQPFMQQIFQEDALSISPAVDTLADWIAGGKPSIRVWCLAYDIVNQNGGVPSGLRMVLTTIKPMLAPFKKDDRDWMRAIAWVRAAWTYIRGNRAFAIDVLTRKLLIIEGQGKFRGEMVDLDAKFGVCDDAISV